MFLNTLAALSLISLASCIRHRAAQTQPPLPGAEYLSHRITYPGETLGVISLWYTQDSSSWKSFYIPATSGSIRKLKRGDEVLIPIKMVIRNEPLGKEFIKAHRQMVSTKEGRVIPDKIPPSKTLQPDDPTITEAVPAELTPLEVEPFEEKANSPVELEKEFIDRIVR